MSSATKTKRRARKARSSADRSTRARFAAGLFDELIIDNFAGGGGASLGIEAAFGRAVDAAVNHDRLAVELHKVNHPHTRHYCEDVWTVSPLEVTGGRPVGLAWFSPDCKHFSRAKGGKPVEKKIRGLAWIVVKWAAIVSPRVIMLENVREFEDWGPLIRRKKQPGTDGAKLPLPGGDVEFEYVPCPKRKGQTFQRWVDALRKLGYAVEWKTLDAADFGAPTHRRRLFLVARRDGQLIRWPEPTHGPSRALPWRTAAECIDWSLPCPSIFLTKEESRALGVIRPLAEKTMKRIAMGLKRFVIEHPNPFIVRVNHGGDHFRGQPLTDPLSTVTGKHGYGVVAPYVAGVGGRAGQSPETGPDDPVGTITAKNDRALVTPYLVAHYGEARHQETRGNMVDEPLRTITPRGGGGFSLIAPHVSQYFGGRVGKTPEEPLPTITACDHYAVVAPFLSQHYGDRPDGSTREGQPVEGPLPTITARGTQTMLSMAALTQYNGRSIGAHPDEPAATVLSEIKTGVVAASLIQYNQEKGNETRGKSVDDPFNVVPTENRFALTAASLVRIGQYGGNGAYANWPKSRSRRLFPAEHCIAAATLVHQNHGEQPAQSPESPLRTVTTQGNKANVAVSHLTKFYGTNVGAEMTDPVPTVTGGGQHLAEVRAFLTKFYGTGAVGQECREPLHTVTAADRFGLVTVEGEPYEIVDIGLRMLTPRELYRAQGFPEEYRIEVPITVSKRVRGKECQVTKPLPKSAQVKMCGNSVCPPVAEALVRANFPEECR